VVAPHATLLSRKQHTYRLFKNRISNRHVEKGWQGVKSQDAEKLKKAIAEQNPRRKIFRNRRLL
jgi:hypothetical protein